jgi:hypothetical protein
VPSVLANAKRANARATHRSNSRFSLRFIRFFTQPLTP